MDERRWERYGAMTGIAFVVLLAASVFVAPAPPHPEASGDKIAGYYVDNSGRVLLATVCGLLAILAFVWFASHLRHVLNRAEGGAEAFAPVVFGSAMVTAAVAAIASLPPATLAFLARSGDVNDGGIMRALYGMNIEASAVLNIAVSLFLAASAAAILRGEMVSRWLGWAGAVAAVTMFVPGVAWIYTTTYQSFWFAAGFAGLALFALWMLALAVQMLRVPEVVRMPSQGSAFAH